MKKVYLLLLLDLATPLLHAAEIKEKESKEKSDKKYNDQATLALIEAFENLDADGVKDALEHGANPNARIDDDNHVTTDPHERSCIAWLLRAAFITYPHTKVKNDLTAQDAFTAILALARSYNLDLSAPINDYNPPPLAYSAFSVRDHYRLYILRALLDNGASINLQDKTGATALMVAANRGNIEAFEFLLDHNAHTYIKDKGGHDVTWFIEQCRYMGDVEKKQFIDIIRERNR